MKSITVSAAILIRTNPQTQTREVLATERGYGAYKGFWEFPGGKLEDGESPETCIVREIREELDAEIIPEKILDKVEFDYPEFHLTMHCILCKLSSPTITLLEHEDAKWLDKKNLQTVNWLPADQLILDKLVELL